MTIENTRTVAVGMSGGVDSSVATYLLKKQGYNVIGVTMKIWDGTPNVNGTRATSHESQVTAHGCYGPGEAADIDAAQKVAKEIGIPHHVLDLRDEYEQMVLKYFRNEYLAGKTPNPCVVCNQKIKFGLLLDKSRQSGISFDFFATGHYARAGIGKVVEVKRLTPVEKFPVGNIQCSCRRRVEYPIGRIGYCLYKALDSKKDQTYFLYRLTQAQLAKVIFPLGNLLKDDVKKTASEIGLKDIADKPESQDFYDSAGYADFFEQGDSQQGDIVDTSGRVVGRHNGVIHYTIGQRKGLNIGGLKDPLYVVEIDIRKNQIIVGPREKVLAKTLIADCLNWISIPAPPGPLEAMAKIRSTQPEKSCTVIPIDANRVRVDFDEPQMAVTPGQSIVFYAGDLVLGGGVIQQHGQTLT